MRYDAFISYRHAELDMYVAKKLHKGLETFRVPRAVAKKSGKKNIKRVFRDQEELPIGSDLGDNIAGALAESEFLLVICSPRTPESYWVQKEIETFIQMHDREHILAILIEGEPDESFPKQLLMDENGNPVEPLAADVRGASKGEIDRKLRSEILRLAAPLLYCSYDDLKQRHRERMMKRMAVGMGAVAGLGAAFGVYNAYNASLIQRNLEGKQENQSKYLAETALSLLEEGNRRAAVLVALEALPSEEDDRPYVAEAQYALSEALYCYNTGDEIQMDCSLRHDLPVQDFSFSDDGTQIASYDQGDYVYVWDVETGEKVIQISPNIDENGYVIDRVEVMTYEDSVIICEEDGLSAFDFIGEELWHVDSEDRISYCEFDEQEGVAACVSGKTVISYQLDDGEKLFVMPNQVETPYSAEMAFSEDKTKFAVSHLTSDDDATAGCVSIYDLETGSVTDIATKSTYIADIIFTSDDCIVVAGNMFVDVSNYEDASDTGYIEKISLDSQEVLWCREYECQIVGLDTASTQVKYRSYQDENTGMLQEQILLSVDNTAYTWNSETGELLAEVKNDSGIVRFLVSMNSAYGYLAGSKGTVTIADMTTGTSYSSSAIETGKELRDVAIRNGVLAMRAYASPDITLMKYHEGAGMQQLESFEISVNNICYSADETYYAVATYTDGLEQDICFYRAEDNSFVGMTTENEENYALCANFIDDETYVMACSDGTIVFYNVPSGERETLVADKCYGSVRCDFNDSSTIAFLYAGNQYYLIDLLSCSILTEGDAGDYIHGGIISEDGRYAYCNMKERGVCRIDCEKEIVESVGNEEYRVLSGSTAQDAFALSTDGKLLAVSCEDGVLRVLNVEKMETVAEIPFAGRNRRFMEFANNNTEIMMQGDDYYFRVYNLEQQEFSHIAVNQYYEIEQAIVDEESGTISLVTLTDMIILNQGDYERIAQIDNGNAYLPKNGKILCSSYDTLYQFPYMTLDMLLEEAENQFGGESLSEFERIQYHVE